MVNIKGEGAFAGKLFACSKGINSINLTQEKKNKPEMNGKKFHVAPEETLILFS